MFERTRAELAKMMVILHAVGMARWLTLAAMGVIGVLATGCTCGSEPAQEQPKGTPCEANSECASGICLLDQKVCAPDCFSLTCPGAGTCTDAGVCEGGCTPESCGPEQFCTAQGKCVPRTPADASIDVDCPDVTVDLDPEIPTVVLLVDRSGSMFDNEFPANSGVTRWDAVKGALIENGGIIPALQTKVEFGVAMYTSNGGNANPPCPIIDDVGAQLSSLNGVQALYATVESNPNNRNNNNPPGYGWDTPTGESIKQVVDNFPPAMGRKVLIVATDGEPDSCVHPNPGNQTIQNAVRDDVVDEVENAFTKDVTTYVLSVGSDVGMDHLIEVARAGQGDDPDDMNSTAVPFVTTNPTELIDDLQSIVLGVRSCDLTLDNEVDENRVDEGTVTLDGTPLEFGTDWELKNSSTVTLLDPVCTTFLNSDSVTVSASFPCGVLLL